MDGHGKPTDVNHAADPPMENPDYRPYLTEDGKPTADLSEAEKVTDPNYSMSISKLKTKIGEVYVAINTASAVVKSGDTW